MPTFPDAPKHYRELMRKKGEMIVHIAQWRDLASDFHESSKGAWDELVQLAQEQYGIDINPMPGEKMGDIFYENGTSGIRPERPLGKRAVATLEAGQIKHIDPKFPYGK